jgi:hypothetical protein
MLSFVCSLVIVAAQDARSNDLVFDTPVVLQADGAAIDVGADIGHAGPLARDMDGDGDLDLYVSSFRGTIRAYENVGTRIEPRYERRPDVRLAGSESALKFENW